MADEESEIRRMAEIADAINAILEADSVGDTPTEVPAQTETQPAMQAEASPLPAETSSPAADADTDVLADDNAMEGIDTSDLDAAIAAELHGDNGTAAQDDHFGPVPVMDFDAPAPRNDEIGRDVKDGSQMANLSLRMQDTLAEIRADHLAHTAGQTDLIGKMEAAREEMMSQVRQKVEQMAADTQSRKQMIAEQIDQIEQQNMMFRDEVNIMLVQFEDQLKQLQAQYFESSVSDRDRLDRYREFLQYLLSERGL